MDEMIIDTVDAAAKSHEKKKEINIVKAAIDKIIADVGDVEAAAIVHCASAAEGGCTLENLRLFHEAYYVHQAEVRPDLNKEELLKHIK